MNDIDVKNKMIYITIFSFIIMLFLSCPATAKTKYHKKLIKRFKELSITQIPTEEYYQGASAVVIMDDMIMSQYYGYYSLWDVTHVAQRTRLWKIIDPTVERLKRIEIDLADVQEIYNLEARLFYPDGSMVRLKKRDMKLTPYHDPITWEEFERGILSLPDLKANMIIELTYKIHYSYPKYWEKYFIEGPDPIYRLRYTLTRPTFHKLAPTRFYEPVTQISIPIYRFRAYDSNRRTYIPVHETKQGYSVTFTNLPPCQNKAYSLPCGNTSSFIEYSVRDLLVKNPLETMYKPEYKEFMNIPAYLSEELKPFPVDNQQEKEDVLRQAGSPAAYRVSFHDWDFIMDYFYYDICEAITKSDVFSEIAAQIVTGSDGQGTSTRLDRAGAIYDYLQTEFTTYSRLDRSHRYAPSLKVLEDSLDRKTATPLTISLIYWGLLYHSDIQAQLGFCLTQDRFCGRFDRQYPVPIHFNASVVVVTNGDEELYLYPGNPSVRFGDLPPEFESADLLVVYFTPKELLRMEIDNRRDVLNNFIEKREYPRLKTFWSQTPASTAKKHSVTTVIDISVNNQSLGHVSMNTHFSGHKETEMRNALRILSSEKRQQYIEQWYSERIKGGTIQSTNVKYLDTLSEQLTFSATADINMDIQPDKLTIPLSFFSQENIYPFLDPGSARRTIFFPYLFSIATTFVVTQNQDWQLEGFPEKTVFSTPEGRYESEVKISDNRIIFTREYNLSKYLYLVEAQEFIKAFFQKLFNCEKNDILTLGKKETSPLISNVEQ